MKQANLLTKLTLAGVLATSTLFGYAGGAGQESSGTHSWTTEQIVTSSAREAWALGGKTEEGFFQIVQALTELSAQKRGITLPDTADAGKKAGDWVKKQAKKDPDQLLYVIVDRAVQYSARKTAGQ